MLLIMNKTLEYYIVGNNRGASTADGSFIHRYKTDYKQIRKQIINIP